MTNHSDNIKSPFLAGIIGLFPGLGHFYTGNSGKGILFLLGLFVVISFLIASFLAPALMYGFESPWSSSSASLLSEDGYYFHTHTGFSFSWWWITPVILLCLGFYAYKSKTVLPVLIVFFFAWVFISLYTGNGFSFARMGEHHSNFFTPYGNTIHASMWESIQVIGLLCLLPILMLYSVADAAVSAVQRNRRMQFGNNTHEQSSMNHNTQDPPPPFENNPRQDELRQGARERGMPV